MDPNQILLYIGWHQKVLKRTLALLPPSAAAKQVAALFHKKGQDTLPACLLHQVVTHVLSGVTAATRRTTAALRQPLTAWLDGEAALTTAATAASAAQAAAAEGPRQTFEAVGCTEQAVTAVQRHLTNTVLPLLSEVWRLLRQHSRLTMHSSVVHSTTMRWQARGREQWTRETTGRLPCRSSFRCAAHPHFCSTATKVSGLHTPGRSLQDLALARECRDALAQFCTVLERSIAASLESCVDAVEGLITRTLTSEQRKADFLPSSTAAGGLDRPTPTCVQVCFPLCLPSLWSGLLPPFAVPAFLQLTDGRCFPERR